MGHRIAAAQIYVQVEKLCVISCFRRELIVEKNDI